MTMTLFQTYIYFPCKEVGVTQHDHDIQLCHLKPGHNMSCMVSGMSMYVCSGTGVAGENIFRYSSNHMLQKNHKSYDITTIQKYVAIIANI